MAPKSSAPPAPALVQSSSSSDESEEEISQSPTAATSNKAPRRQFHQPEASEEKGEADEEEQEEVEEVEKEAQEEDQDEEEEEEAEEHEEEQEANHTAPPPATNNRPPPPAHGAEVELGKEGEEEEAQPKSGRKSKAKKPADPFQRSWSKNDDVRILEVLAAYRLEHNKLPKAKDIEADLAGKLDTDNHDRKGLGTKLKSLKAMYGKKVKNGFRPSTDTERRVLELSKEIWGVIGNPKKGAAPVDFGKIRGSFPHLAGMMKELDRKEPDLFKREFSLVDPVKARVLDQKIKKQRVELLKLEMREHKLMMEVIKALVDLME